MAWMGRGVLVATLCAAAVVARAQQPAAKVKVTPTSKRVADNPTVNLASTKPAPKLPAAALALRPREHESEHAAWAMATWTHAILSLPATAKHGVTLSGPGTVMVRASWKGPTGVSVTLARGGTTLATALASKSFDGTLLATARAKVPSAGEVVVQAAGAGSQAVNVDLYIGVLPDAH